MNVEPTDRTAMTINVENLRELLRNGVWSFTREEMSAVLDAYEALKAKNERRQQRLETVSLEIVSHQAMIYALQARLQEAEKLLQHPLLDDVYLNAVWNDRVRDFLDGSKPDALSVALDEIDAGCRCKCDSCHHCRNRRGHD